MEVDRAHCSQLFGPIPDCEDTGERLEPLWFHAWTDGPTRYLVYQAPPSPSHGDWSAIPENQSSTLHPGLLKEAVRYYYLLDLCENRVSAAFPIRGMIPKSFCGTVIGYTPKTPAKGSPTPNGYPRPVSVRRSDQWLSQAVPLNWED